VGKLGCFFSGDGCYGVATSLPWGMAFPRGLVPTRRFVHPVPLYEFSLSLAVYVFFATRPRKISGVLACDTIAVFSLTRVVVEIWRDHPATLLGLSQFQVLALAMAALAFALRFGALALAQRPTAGAKEKSIKTRETRKTK
jgi:phosphatidylglycerol:prolipoprotein diacylglycerol transferase